MVDGEYRERASIVAGGTIWTRTPGPGDGSVRILPDGCLDLIWSESRLLIAGPDAVARLAPTRPGAHLAGLRFAPGLGPVFLGVPASELVDAQPALDAVWPSWRARRLEAMVAAAPDPASGFEAALARERDRISGSARNAAMERAAGSLGRGNAVAAVAAEIGFSQRQLQRRSLAAFGYGPKHLARILRLQRALVAVRGGVSLALVAAECGYADQSHLARDARALAGVPLRELIAEAGPQAVDNGAKRSTPLPSGSWTVA